MIIYENSINNIVKIVQEAHESHRSTDTQLQSVNRIAQSYDYTIKLITRETTVFFFEN